MGKLIAVKGCQLSVSTAKIDTNPVNTMTIDGKNPYAGNLTIKIQNYNGQGITNADGQGQAVLNPSAKNTLDGKKFVLEGDSVTVQVTGTTTTSSGKSPVGPVPVNVKISSAGQTTTSSD